MTTVTIQLPEKTARIIAEALSDLTKASNAGADVADVLAANEYDVLEALATALKEQLP